MVVIITKITINFISHYHKKICYYPFLVPECYTIPPDNLVGSIQPLQPVCANNTPPDRLAHVEIASLVLTCRELVLHCWDEAWKYSHKEKAYHEFIMRFPQLK